MTKVPSYNLAAEVEGLTGAKEALRASFSTRDYIDVQARFMHAYKLIAHDYRLDAPITSEGYGRATAFANEIAQLTRAGDLPEVIATINFAIDLEARVACYGDETLQDDPEPPPASDECEVIPIPQVPRVRCRSRD